jgi:hypothetical protein
MAVVGGCPHEAGGPGPRVEPPYYTDNTIRNSEIRPKIDLKSTISPAKNTLMAIHPQRHFHVTYSAFASCSI